MRTQAETPQDKENINILNIHKHPEKNSLPSLSKLKITKANSSFTTQSTQPLLESVSEKQRKKNRKRYESIVTKHYVSNQNESLLLTYGESNYHFDKSTDDQVIPESFMNRHNISQNIHLKMIDWMIEVLSVYHSSHETFFLSVYIMDRFIEKSRMRLKSENIHLIGVTSMFIASKFIEIYPISMDHIINNIGHNQFHASVVKAQEIKMLSVISFESLISCSIYEFLKTFFFGFFYNNKESIKSIKFEEFYRYLKETSLYLAKVTMHYKRFYAYANCTKALCCIVAGKKIVMEKCRKVFNNEQEAFYEQWINFLIEQNEFDPDEVEDISQQIFCAYLNYQTATKINKSLNRFSSLSFVNKYNK